MDGELTAAIENAFDNEPPREYRSSRIGASIIGNPCTAYLSYAIRGFPEGKIGGRLKRIFRDGHRIEDVVIQDLKKAGYDVEKRDQLTGDQYKWDAYNGYLVYYADGIITTSTGEAILLEVKSMNSSLFERFKSRGMRVSHPKYYDQIQVGLGLSGMKKAVLIAYNKDNSEYWDEVVDFDMVTYLALSAKAEMVLMGMATKVGSTPADWRCKDCPKKGVCWENEEVVKDVRTCAHSYPDKGKWSCPNGCTTECLSWERYKPLEKL